jgi:hypothetical protein
MDTFLAIVSKRDQRQYADREIPADVLDRILQAGRLAGSAMNRQPWRFVVLESTELREQVAKTVYAPGNVVGSKVAIALVVKGSPGFDAGRAAQNMMLAAWNDGSPPAQTECPTEPRQAGSSRSTKARRSPWFSPSDIRRASDIRRTAPRTSGSRGSNGRLSASS